MYEWVKNEKLARVQEGGSANRRSSCGQRLFRQGIQQDSRECHDFNGAGPRLFEGQFLTLTTQDVLETTNRRLREP